MELLKSILLLNHYNMMSFHRICLVIVRSIKNQPLFTLFDVKKITLKNPINLDDLF